MCAMQICIKCQSCFSLQIDPNKLAEAAKQIVEDLLGTGALKNFALAATTYTALARMAATARLPDEALDAAHDMLGIPGAAPRLRAFTPALLAYCADRNWRGAFQVRVVP